MRSDTDRNKKRLGALLSALSVGGFMVIVAVCMLVDYFGSGGTAAETLTLYECLVLLTGIRTQSITALVKL